MTEAAELTAEKVAYYRARTEAVELRNEQLKGELVPKADVAKAVAAAAAEWDDLARATRSRLLAVPSRVLQQSPHLTPRDKALIEAEIRDALTELAERVPPAAKAAAVGVDGKPSASSRGRRTTGAASPPGICSAAG